MGKNKKRKRQKHSLVVAAATTTGGRLLEDDDNESPSSDDDSAPTISDLDLSCTVRTLEILAQNPASLLQDKRYKSLRRALHPLVLHQLASYHQGTDYRTKVTQALEHQKWTDALAALQGCRDFGQLPKQGTIQRWVRDVDLAPSSCKLLLLNAILLVNQENTHDTETLNLHDPQAALAQHLAESKSVAMDNGDAESNSVVKTGDPGLVLLEDWSLGKVMTDIGEDWDALPPVHLESKILYSEKAADRKPPNHYDLYLHTTTAPGSIEWMDDLEETPIRKHDVPFLQSLKGQAFCLENVLTLGECQQLRAAATTLGFRPDHPTSLDQPTGIDSCEWLVDDSILEVLNRRVQPFLSSTTSTLKFHSINPRWRFFRYGQGCVYRPHIDGSWPASRINQQGQYECYDHLEDKETGTRTIKSYHTFLMYLNDNFEGGETRFYFPQQGQVAAQGVVPKCGSVLVFSQGNTASLLHEGSAVTAGTKYVVRTDVLYTQEQESSSSK